ncbi:gamma-glutamyltransferase [Nodularia spumigena]|uniref:gamma-glutamyltransferase n=1 Tax=Nodularia spumigena TaxID=70799 RepID=UPI00232CD757|nr:gamma-glutamyltransferase [Nodularia spumigena]MDB9319744.1 gamma-glutamyltransferase [Nodularia spumigena CS-590/01A]MDB9321313.1 gamma-glutamyltransferase [Nodularia spumigena CS-591/07A]MDB9326090.1 gamma-glutamyltransferase [Nodularia spumigena CS-590/02]MDB9329065.1 gamma-glutamyltransferase [Nodularia spumigena CS-591/04]MDB9336723.1 gamma-glutamyltransferase [Nodularia spumigena CS-590/01]
MPIFNVSRQITISTKRFAIAVFSCSLIIYSQAAIATITSPLRSKKGMVVSAHPLASDAGITMLRQGGNAVDAAVATTFAISVVEPFSAGIGGGGFLLMHSGKTGEIKALDFRERAPLKATKDMYLDADGKVRPNASVTGYLAVATPGTVAGMYEVHRLYGKLPWAEVVKPAIALAQDGFILRRVLSPSYLTVNNTRLQTMLNNPGMREIFTRDGEFYQPGERLVQRDLARTLTDIARSPHSFYTGNIAWAIASDMAKNGGLITLEDLKAYKPIWRNPVCGKFRQAKICSMPPPSSGGVHLLQMLNIIGETDLQSLGWHHPDALHLMVEAMKIAYADRSEFLGDPDFIKVPVEKLISPDYAQKRRLEIDMKRAKPASQIKPVDLPSFPTPHGLLPTPILPKESTETSHLTVVDDEHNAVSLTFTINLGFGAGIATPGTGIVLNNQMDDFAAAPGVPNAFGLVGNEANALAQLANGIAPRKTPLSSMTPTIITENGRLRMAVGTPGGSTIITQVLQIILNVLEYQMDVGAAVSVPRIHHQWLPDQLRVERWGLDTLTLQELRRRGHKINESNSWGNANAIAVTAEGDLEAAADPRGQGFTRSF